MQLISFTPEDLKQLIETAVSRAIAEVPRKRTCLTRAQLADEWQCTEQAIVNWTQRKANWLPVHYIGSDPRFYRAEFEQWSREEADRRLAAKRAA